MTVQRFVVMRSEKFRQHLGLCFINKVLVHFALHVFSLDFLDRLANATFKSDE